MGIIIEFRRPEEQAARVAGPVEGSLGEIIIFPGVRIERYRQASDDLPEYTGAARGRAQRGRKK